MGPWRSSLARRRLLAPVIGVLLLLLALPAVLERVPHFAFSAATPVAANVRRQAAAAPPAHGIHRIRHVIMVMQENRSFDEYFGTFPGADGLPRQHGRFTSCVPDRALGHCVRPYHDPAPVNTGGPHAYADAVADIDGGRMDGFIRRAFRGAHDGYCRRHPTEPRCVVSTRHPDVMGFKTGADLPTYWAYARSFVLQDHMFAQDLGWSLPAHLDLVSGWSARCRSALAPMSCHTDLDHPGAAHKIDGARFAWTDLTYLLHRAGVSWRYYVARGQRPDCPDGQLACAPVMQDRSTPSIWNPLPRFTTVHQDHQVRNVQLSRRFFAAARSGTLPAVCWIVPNEGDSEHPPASVDRGQRWVRRIVDAVMRSPDWSSSAIFISWDDWGGFYDHVRPPRVPGAHLGLRVPGLLVSPYARRGYVDHQLLTPAAYLRFVEDDFLHGQRLDPRTDGRPDSRPLVVERERGLGDLRREFDFRQPPRPPLLAPPPPKARPR